MFASIAAGQSAVDLVRQKKYAEARRAAASMPEPTAARDKINWHRLRAAIASGLGEHGGAADEMALALAVDPLNQDLLLATAVAELNADRLDQALAHATPVQTAAGWATVGDIQERRREFVAAAQAYQRAVELAPGVEAYRVALALELVRHATFEPALVVLEQAAPMFPQSSRIRVLKAVTQYAMGQVGPAFDSLLEAIAVDPRHEPAHQYLAQLALEAPGEAPRNVEEALCRWDEKVCAALRLRRDPADRAAQLKLRSDAGAMARCELGRAFERLEDWPSARQALEACVAQSPAPQNHYRLGRVYQRLGLKDAAQREMDRYRAASRQQSEDAARREAAIQAFQVTMR